MIPDNYMIFKDYMVFAQGVRGAVPPVFRHRLKWRGLKIMNHPGENCGIFRRTSHVFFIKFVFALDLTDYTVAVSTENH